MSPVFHVLTKPDYIHVLFIAALCTVTTCANGGTCIDSGTSFFCFCPSGYEGTLCESGMKHTNIIHNSHMLLYTRTNTNRYESRKNSHHVKLQTHTSTLDHCSGFYFDMNRDTCIGISHLYELPTSAWWKQISELKNMEWKQLGTARQLQYTHGFRFLRGSFVIGGWWIDHPPNNKRTAEKSTPVSILNMIWFSQFL